MLFFSLLRSLQGAIVAIPDILKNRLSLPAVGAPLFIISNPKLVIAQCTAGIVGSFPSLNARSIEELDDWLSEIGEQVDSFAHAYPDKKVAPFAVNQIVHKSNTRMQQDLALCVKHKAPIVITSLGAVPEVNEAVHSYGGIVLHDVINIRHAHSAIRKGADGLIAVATGAGGHAGKLSPIALIQEIREWFDGPLLLSGSIATGGAVLAAQAMGADLAYLGTPFIATEEANAIDAYKQAIIDAKADDVINTNLFTGIDGNYLRSSIINAGMDPDNLAEGDLSHTDFSSGGKADAKAWKDIWGAGQGVGVLNDIIPTQTLVDRLIEEYQRVKKSLI